MKEKKYKKGAEIKFLDELKDIVFVREEHLFLDEKPLSPFWVANFTFITVVNLLKAGRFFRAE